MTSKIIDHMGADGDGMARDAAGHLHAVPFALPGELVDADGQICASSADRIAPVCPHFGPCGGCQLQHWHAGPYLAWKRAKVQQALARVGLVDVPVAACFAVPPGHRRRVALHARWHDGRVHLGFKTRKSWTVIDIHACAVMTPALVAALPSLRHLAHALFVPKAAPVLHVTDTATGLDVEISGVTPTALNAAARQQLVTAAAQMDLARLSLSGEVLMQTRAPVVAFDALSATPPPGGFLQAAACAETEMLRLTREAIGRAKQVADLFCGMGTFSLPLARQAQVLAADSTPAAIAALRAAARAPKLKPIRAEVRDLFRTPYPARQLKDMDAIVFDPPRAGAEAQSQQIAASGVPVVVGISCNTSSFARDARILCDGGYRLDHVTPIDQFLWSAHIELVGVFRLA